MTYAKVINAKDAERIRALIPLFYMAGTLPLYANEPKKLPKLDDFMKRGRAAKPTKSSIRDLIRKAPVFKVAEEIAD